MVRELIPGPTGWYRPLVSTYYVTDTQGADPFMESHPLMDLKSQKGAEVQPGPVVQGAGLQPFLLAKMLGFST